MRRFFATPERIGETEISLDLDESRHLRDVLRLSVGDEVSVFNGVGDEYSCRIVSTGSRKDSALLQLLNASTPPSPESPLRLTLAIALLKGEKFDLVIQKTTELGVRNIIPLITKRADVKIKDSGDALKKNERWQRIALEAAKQCGRAFVPQVSEPVTLSDLLAAKNEGTEYIFFAEKGGGNLGKNPDLVRSDIMAIVGPEGGWAEEEIASAISSECRIITLGGRVLRAETAGIVTVALLQISYGDLA